MLQTQNRLHNAASIEASETWLPDIWSKLGNTVCRTPREGRSKIAVNDSKILYQSGKGLRQLEKGVLPFLESCGIAPGNLSELLTAVSLDSESADCRLPWYRNETEAPELPLHWPKEEIHELGARLRCAGVASRA